MRLLTVFAACLFFSVNAYAIDLQALGRPLDDDTHTMEDRYVYMDGNTTDKNVPLDKPVLINPDIQDWLSQRVAEVMKLDGAQYEQQVTVNRRHFTEHGYLEYVASLEAAQIPKLLKEQHYTMSAVIIDPPNIYAKGLRDEGGDKTQPGYKEKLVHVWQAEVPVTLNYQNLNGTTGYKVYLTAEIVRIPMQESGTLVAINSWKFSTKPRQILKKTAP